MIGEDGWIVSPQGVRLRVPARFVVRDEAEESEEERQARAQRMQAVFDKIAVDCDEVSLKP